MAMVFILPGVMIMYLLVMYGAYLVLGILNSLIWVIGVLLIGLRGNSWIIKKYQSIYVLYALVVFLIG